MYRKQSRPTIVGTVHAYNGIFLITLGMINGGLGLLYGGGAISGSEAIAYGVITAVIWIAFMAYTVMGRVKRTKSLKDEKRVLEGTT